MLKSEFVGRTNYCPSDEEYSYIETSYLESPLNMDDFCKQWASDYCSGKWSNELRLRMAIGEWQAKYHELEERTAMLEDQVEFYEPYYERALRAENAIKMLGSAIGYAQFCVDVYQRIEQQYKDEDKEDAE